MLFVTSETEDKTTLNGHYSHAQLVPVPNPALEMKKLAGSHIIHTHMKRCTSWDTIRSSSATYR